MSFISCSKNEVSIVIPRDADKIERLAARELQKYLSQIYSETNFVISDMMRSKKVIYLGTKEHLKSYKLENIVLAEDDEGFTINTCDNYSGVIISEESRGVLYGVYSLLEKLGYSFVFSGDIQPSKKNNFDFKEWNFSNNFLVKERTVFNWHNFLSGCTGWDDNDWYLWIDQSQKMGYNTIMIHAYANNPIYTFRYNGIEKPVGYLASSINGRDWSTEHVNDVRRLPGGNLFVESVFGSEATKVPEQQKVEKAQRLINNVFQYAEDRGVNVNFAIDFDIVASIPQNMVKTMPINDRFLVQHKGIGWMGEKAGPVWIPRPDKPAGYDYYKKQVKRILELYPQIDIFTLWRRSEGSVWVELKLEELPKEWQQEYRQYIKENPEALELEQNVGAFAMSKLVRAYRKAFNELGRNDLNVRIGTWSWGPLKAMNEFLPEDVTVYILDSEVIRGKEDLHKTEMVDKIADWIKTGKVIPVIWPHHDDGAYIGSPLKEYNNFYDILSKLKADGFGVIHWMTRPFDSFFIHHIKQVQRTTANQVMDTTNAILSKKWFGETNNNLMKIYLKRWNDEMPSFGRETGSAFIDEPHYFKFQNAATIVGQCKERIELLRKIKRDNLSKSQFQWWNYFLNYEIFVRDFFIEQDKYIKADKLLETGNFDKAKNIIKTFNPEAVLQQYAQAISYGTATKGEKGLLFSMGVRWLPYFISLKQVVGLEDVRINFDHTSHEELAQMPGRRTYFIDKEKRFWEVYGEQETGFLVVENNSDRKEVFQNGIKVDKMLQVQLSSLIHKKKIIPEKYRLKLFLIGESSENEMEITFQNNRKERFVYQGYCEKEFNLDLKTKNYQQ